MASDNGDVVKLETGGEVSFGRINEEYEKILNEAIEHNQNLCNSAGKTSMLNFQKVASEALRDVESGRKTTDQAVREAVAEYTKRGELNVTYQQKNGKTRQVNVKSALTMNVRSTAKRAAMANSLEIGKQLNCDHWEVSAHNDCADDHLWLNGIVVKDGSKEFDEVVEALQRPNCRHFISPFWEGYSEKTDYGLSDEATIRNNYTERQAEKRTENELSKQQLYNNMLEFFTLDDRFKNKTIHEVENIIFMQAKETMVVFNHGSPYISRNGTEGNVYFGKEAVEYLANKNLTFVHNHPGDGGSFSDEDLMFFSTVKPAEGRVTDRWYSYSIKAGKNGWPDPKEIAGFADSQLNIEYKKVISDQNLDFRKMNDKDYLKLYREAKHKTLLQIAAKYGIIYRRKRRNNYDEI